MAISTYGELKTAVANWLNRSDLTALIPDFITLAESRIHYGRSKRHTYPSDPLRCRWMETTVTLSPTSGTTALPTGFLQARRLYVDEAIDRPLTQLSPEQLKSINAGSTAGTPVYYAIAGENFEWAPQPSSGSIECLYYKKFTAFSADGDSNSLLTNAPNVYLYGALLESMPYLRNDQRVPMWAELYGGAVDGLNESDKQDRYSGSAMVIQTLTGTP